MGNRVSVVFICDENYAMPTAVAITSLIKNKKRKTLYEINVLADNISLDSHKKFLELNKKNITINVINVKNKYTNLGPEHLYVSKSALLKFDIANIFNNYEKILYLDSDIIVKEDLSEIFNTDITDYYVGAITDMCAVLKNFHTNLNLKNYFNSGVMLLNLEKIRKENLVEKLIETKRNSVDIFQDQTAFNIVFAQKVKYLPCKFNYQSNYKDFSKKQIENFYNEKINKITILHLTNLKKVWHYDYIYGFSEWIKYYKKSPYKNIPIKFKKTNKTNIIIKLIKLIKYLYAVR